MNIPMKDRGGGRMLMHVIVSCRHLKWEGTIQNNHNHNSEHINYNMYCSVRYKEENIKTTALR